MDGKYQETMSMAPREVTGRVEENERVTPEAKPLAPITLLYGFAPFRDFYSARESSENEDAQIVIVDDLNNCLDLVKRTDEDYAGAIRAIRNMGGSINQAEQAHYTAEAYSLMGTTRIKSPQHAMSLILSWRKFLSEHVDELKIMSLVKSSKMLAASPRDATSRLFGFFNKNLLGELHDKEKEVGAVKKLGELLNGPNPEVSISEAMKSNVSIRFAVRTAFIRKVCKLGLDWARSQPQLHTVFIDGAFSDEVKRDIDKRKDMAHWRSFTQEDEAGLSKKPYSRLSRIASYLPITYSEMKHVRRLNYNVERMDIMRYVSGSTPEREEVE